MENKSSTIKISATQVFFRKWFHFSFKKKDDKVMHPFWVIVQKEISDHVKSWRFLILMVIIALTCFGSLYTALANVGKFAVKGNEFDDSFFFLNLFTVTDDIMKPFFVYISFLGPLLGISMGFDAVNTEHNKGTLSRILAQPIHRDYILNAKFVASLIVISVMFFALGMLMTGIGLIAIGIPPSVEEFLRILLFIGISIVYVAFWLNLAILFSVRFRQPATAALSALSIWLLLTIFYPLIVDLVTKSHAPNMMSTEQQVVEYTELKLNLLRLLPSELFSEATQTILMPGVRSIGPLTMEQAYATIPGPLPLGQSILLVWPQLTGLLAATLFCFVISYISFMKREIRSR